MVDRRNLVEFVERALLLKSLPVLSEASPDQIAAIIHHLSDRSFMPGAPLFRAGDAASEIHFVLEGRARLEQAGGTVTRGPGDVVGLLSALEQRPRLTGCVSETAVQTVVLRRDDLFDLLEDFFDLTRSLFAYLARRLATLLDGESGGLLDPGGAPFVGRTRPIDLIDKIVFMKSVPLLAGASVDELARLGKEVAEAEYGAGEVVFRAGERAEAFYLVLTGRLGRRGARTTVGALDVLQQGGYAHTMTAEEPTRVLRVPAERFFDLLEDHFDLTSRIARDMSGAARMLLARKQRA